MASAAALLLASLLLECVPGDPDHPCTEPPPSVADPPSELQADPESVEVWW